MFAVPERAGLGKGRAPYASIPRLGAFALLCYACYWMLPVDRPARKQAGRVTQAA
jgi:hypothetical protein